MKTKTDSISIRGTHVTRINTRKSKDGKFDWLDGEVITPHGTVCIMAQGDNFSFHHTRWDFACNGRLYMRTIDKRISPRGIVREAKRFVSDIVLNRHEQH